MNAQIRSLAIALLNEKIRLMNLLKDLPENQHENIRSRLGGIDFSLRHIETMGY